MMRFIAAGGFGMLFVILFGGITLVAAMMFAFRPELRKLAFIRGMTWATVFAIVSAVFANFLAVARFVGMRAEGATPPAAGPMLLPALGEAVTPAVLGFAVLAITWFAVAMGTRRAQHDVE